MAHVVNMNHTDTRDDASEEEEREEAERARRLSNDRNASRNRNRVQPICEDVDVKSDQPFLKRISTGIAPNGLAALDKFLHGDDDPYSKIEFPVWRRKTNKSVGKQRTKEKRLEEAAHQIQAHWQNFTQRHNRLDRKNLVARLRHEKVLVPGAFRLLMLAINFSLLVLCLNSSEPSYVKNAIQHNLDAVFDFEALRARARTALRSCASLFLPLLIVMARAPVKLPRMKGVNTRSGIWDMLREFSGNTREFFPRTTAKFESSYRSVQVLGAFQGFTEPQRVTTPDMAIDAQLETEVESGKNLRKASASQRLDARAQCGEVTEDFSGGNILAKALPGDMDKKLACWGWVLSPQMQPCLIYNAHTYYNTEPVVNHGPQHLMKCTNMDKPVIERDVLTLMTLVVTKTNVTFFKGLESVATLPLSEPLSDCYSPDTMIVGDRGLKLGSVMFYPSIVNKDTLTELMAHGETLEFISRAAEPLIYESAGSEVGEALGEDHNLFFDKLATLAATITEQNAQNLALSMINAIEPRANEEVDFSNFELVNLPLGSLKATNLTPSMDATAGREYYSLQAEARSWTDTDVGGFRYYNRTQLPSFKNQGATFTFWWRSPKPEKEPYILAGQPGMEADEICWSFWLNPRGYGFRYKAEDGGIARIVKRDVLDVTSQMRANTWRHVVFQLDNETDTLQVFVDGEEIDKHELPKDAVSHMEDECDVQEGVVAVGHQFPGYMWGGEQDVADLRMWLGGAPLTELQVQGLATDPPSKVTVECLPPHRMVDDTHWRNSFQMSCEFLAQAVVHQPRVCATEDARKACPLACRVTQCVSPRRPPVHYLWKEIKYIDNAIEKGTICLSSDTSKSQEVAACRTAAAAGNRGGAAYQAHIRNKPHENRKRLNVTDCDMLEAAIDESCAFDAGPVKTFTQEMVKNGGSFTVFFWVHPLPGRASMDPMNQFLPHLSFFESLQPARESVVIEAQHTGNYDWMSFQVPNACDHQHEQGKEYNHAKWMDDGTLSKDKWTLITLTHDASRSSIRAGINEANVTEPGISDGNYRYCPVTSETVPMMFTALETNYPMKISPIGLVSQALSHAEQQQLYRQLSEGMSIRSGPQITSRAQASVTYPSSKSNPDKTMMYLAPPLLIQQRTTSPSQCARSDFAKQLLKDEVQRIQYDYCRAPQECDEWANNPDKLIFCPEQSAVKGDEPFFGLNSTEFQGQEGYVDFLYSYTDKAFLTRSPCIGCELEALNTEDFIDERTVSLKLINVLHSPEHRTTTLMEVEAELAGALEAVVDVEVTYHVILEGNALRTYLMLQIIGTFFVELQLVFSLQKAISQVRQYLLYRTVPPTFEIVALPVDLFVLGLMNSVMVMQIIEKTSSSEKATGTLGAISSIDWVSNELTPEERVEHLLTSVNQLYDMVQKQMYMDNLALLVLFLLVAEVTMALNCHPRMALLTSTVMNCIDETWHTLLIVLIFMYTYTAIGVWQFGGFNDAFLTADSTLQTLFSMMLGMDMPDDWNVNWAMITYCVSFIMVIFVLVFNFVLVIVLEAYMKVRKDNEDNEIEIEFFSDTIVSLLALLKSKWYKWPDHTMLARTFDSWEGIETVEYLDLVHLFPNRQSAIAFSTHYRRFDFLESNKRQVTNYDERLVNEIELRTALLLGRVPEVMTNKKRMLQRVVTSAQGETASVGQSMRELKAMMQQMSEEMTKMAAQVAHLERQQGSTSGGGLSHAPPKTPSTSTNPLHRHSIVKLPPMRSSFNSQLVPN